MLDEVFAAFGLTAAKATAFGPGLINHTWKVEDARGIFILQRVNTSIFRQPEAIAANISAIGAYLQQNQPGYLFPVPLKTTAGKDYYCTGNDYYRLIPFVNGSHTISVTQQPQQAYEAAAQFGKFTSLLRDFDTNSLQTTLPDFHNLSLRFKQFETALQNGNPERIIQSSALIAAAQKHRIIVNSFEAIRQNKSFQLRVTHHDTKISNVLFDSNNKGMCVIDLDTVMPGYFISDAGDMMRTYICPVSEEEKDLSLITIREDYFEALARGYLQYMGDVLTSAEKDHFIYAGKFMIYMQALRFLTDHLNNDIYYGAKYEGHNSIRAANQFTLLDKLTEKETALQQLISDL